MTHGAPEDMWTTRLRKRALESLPPEKVLPDTQPAYVASWTYLFGALTIAAFVVVCGARSSWRPGAASAR
jgi:ubiquinol-cytochrome c reductase cytochrome b subunit